MNQDFIKEKSREISYVLIRVAFYVKRPELSSRFEHLAFELIDVSARVSVENTGSAIVSALSIIASLDAMVRLAHSIYEIEPINATILIRELNNLNSAIRQFGKLDDKLPELESLFSAIPVSNQVSAPVSFGNNSDVLLSGDDESLDAYRAPLDNSSGKSVSLKELSSPLPEKSNRDNQSANIAVRQSAILEKIKSLPAGSQAADGDGCRLKDILAVFPDVSERTIRYDIQKLCDSGVIERVGNGGPATYYRVRS